MVDVGGFEGVGGDAAPVFGYGVLGHGAGGLRRVAAVDQHVALWVGTVAGGRGDVVQGPRLGEDDVST